MRTRDLLTTAGGGATALLLVWLASQSPALGLVGLGLAGGLLLLAAFGPERLGAGMITVGMFLAPQNDLRPVQSMITFNFGDVFLFIGLALLFPRLLRHEARLPVAFAVGAFALFVLSIASSVAAADAGYAGWLAFRMIAASILLPIGMLYWGPRERQVTALAWAYLLGQLMSTLSTLLEEPLGGRYQGTAYHPNFFSTAAVLALALVPYLWQRSERHGRVLLLVSSPLLVWGIHLSGSRGGLLALAALVLVYPLIERSALSMYAVLTAFFTMIPLVGVLASLAPKDSALGRLTGKDETAEGANDIRREELGNGWERFLDHPVLGSGYVDNLSIHNVFLQMAVAVGVVGFIGWLMMMATLVLPLFDEGRLRRLGYVALGYLGMGLTEPLLWDRVVWAPLALCLLAAAPRQEDAPSDGGTQTEQAPRAHV